MAAPMQMPHKKSKAGRFILIFLLLVLLVGGGGAAAYIGYIIPNKPEYRLLKAVSNATAKSKSTALVEITAKTRENPQAATLKFQVSTDLDQKKYAISGTFGYTGMSLPIEARLINKNIYAKVSGISSLLSGMSSMFTSADSASSKAMMDAISSIDSQWFVIDSSLIESDQAASCLTGLSYKLSDADNKILENAYRKYPIVNVTSSASATVDDVKTTKYTVEPRKENLNGFGEMFKTTEIYKSAAACTAKESSTGIDEQISTAVEGDSEIGDLAFYVTGDKQLKRLEFKGTGDSEGSSFALTFKDETVNIDTPSNTKPVQDVLGTLLGLAGMYSSASM